MKIIPRETAKTVEELAGYVMAADAKNCKGVFASGRYPTATESGATRLVTGCSGGKDAKEVSYTIAPRPKGGFYVFSTIGTNGEAGPVQETGARLHEAAIKSIAPR